MGGRGPQHTAIRDQIVDQVSCREYATSGITSVTVPSLLNSGVTMTPIAMEPMKKGKNGHAFCGNPLR